MEDGFFKFTLPFLKQTTQNSYTSAVKKHIRLDLGRMPIKIFRHSDVQRYYNDLRKRCNVFSFQKRKFLGTYRIGEYGSRFFAVYVRLRLFFGSGGFQSGQRVVNFPQSMQLRVLR
ncbi:MAG: hypothetical protein IJ752_09055 [Alphaproteobacteria bacterium]|nr:hypothetical protein [Alphaproteobacteria bacterium]